jgi:hypothetical protein
MQVYTIVSAPDFQCLCLPCPLASSPFHHPTVRTVKSSTRGYLCLSNPIQWPAVDAICTRALLGQAYDPGDCQHAQAGRATFFAMDVAGIVMASAIGQQCPSEPEIRSLTQSHSKPARNFGFKITQ